MRKILTLFFAGLVCAIGQTNSSVARASKPQTCQIDPNGGKVQVAGAVYDSSGAAIISATVSLVCGVYSQEIHTGPDGRYSFSAPTGRFDVAASAPGFETAQKNINLSVEKQALDFTLNLGRSASIVSVTALRLTSATPLPFCQLPESTSMARHVSPLTAIVRRRRQVSTEEL